MAKVVGRPFKKGQSGNLAGRPKMSTEYHLVRLLTKDSVKHMISKYLSMSTDELIALLGRGDLPATDAFIVGIITKGLEDGDFVKFNFLLDRTIGKVKDELEVSKNYKEMSDEELLLEYKKELNEFQESIEAKYKEIKDV